MEFIRRIYFQGRIGFWSLVCSIFKHPLFVTSKIWHETEEETKNEFKVIFKKVLESYKSRPQLRINCQRQKNSDAEFKITEESICKILLIFWSLMHAFYYSISYFFAFKSMLGFDGLTVERYAPTHLHSIVTIIPL